MHLPVATLFAVTLAAAVPCAAQTMRAEDLAQGKIIVTPRDAPDPHFARSVILLARYDRSGALGLMIHRRTDIPVQRALAGVSGAGNRSEPVYIGGPVDLGMVFALVRNSSPGRDAKPVAGNVYLLGTKPGIGKALEDTRDAAGIRVVLGYAGWAPGQLESEVRRSAWYIFDFDEGLVFDAHPETLWDRLIARTERRLAGGRLRWHRSGLPPTLRRDSNSPIRNARYCRHGAARGRPLMLRQHKRGSDGVTRKTVFLRG